jgi:hypothetical protein
MSETKKDFPALDPQQVKRIVVFASVLLLRTAPPRVRLAHLLLRESEE